jgi:hypothetical protein
VTTRGCVVASRRCYSSYAALTRSSEPSRLARLSYVLNVCGNFAGPSADVGVDGVWATLVARSGTSYGQKMLSVPNKADSGSTSRDPRSAEYRRRSLPLRSHGEASTI